MGDKFWLHFFGLLSFLALIMVMYYFAVPFEPFSDKLMVVSFYDKIVSQEMIVKMGTSVSYWFGLFFWLFSIILFFCICSDYFFRVFEGFFLKHDLKSDFIVPALLLSVFVLFFAFFRSNVMLFLSVEDKYVLYEQLYEREKKELESKYESEIREARAFVRIAELDVKRRELLNNKKIDHNTQITSLKLAQDQLKALQLRGVDYESINHQIPQNNSQYNDKTKLVLSGLWLGFCFFLQRLFEKVFHDKGYALLAVCAVGFLIAFFSANYFLLGGSVTGGLIGATGSRS